MQAASLRSSSGLRLHATLGTAPSMRNVARAFKATGVRPLPGRCNVSVTRASMGDVPSSIDHLAATLTTALFLADVDPSAAAGAAVEAADTAKKGGFFSIFSDTFESFLKLIDDGFDKAGVPYSYGFAIIAITLLVKIATYPLSAKQVESTLSMQALQPKVKELQAKFANDPERLQVETAKLYQTAGVNPLAGCLPTLATIPVFIGLYRALSNVAGEGLLTEGFFWIPSLAGPTELNGGLGWLVPQNGVPPLGWHDTLSYLVLPVLLVVSQYASQKIISPPASNDPAQQQSQAILKFIPLMIGWFSLNVPSGLTLYWFTNNLVTTAQQVYLRRKFNVAEAGAAAGGSGSSSAPMMGGAANRSAAPAEPERPKGKEINARRSAKAQSSVIDIEAETVSSSSTPSSSISTPSSSSTSQSQSAGEKFRALKAREAAARAAGQAATGSASVADTNGNGNGAAAAAAAVESEVAGGSASVSVEAADSVKVPDAPPAKDGFSSGGGSSRGKGGAAKKTSSKKKK